MFRQRIEKKKVTFLEKDFPVHIQYYSLLPSKLEQSWVSKNKLVPARMFF